MIFQKIAKLHRDSIKTGFLSTLPLNFLASLYASISKNKYAILILAIRDKDKFQFVNSKDIIDCNAEIVGFISGTLNIKKMYKSIIIKNFFQFAVLLLPAIINWNTIKKIFETLFYSNSNSIKKTEIINSELLSIAVDPNFRKQKIGQALITQLEEYFDKNKYFTYKVVTFSQDTVSNSFYLKNGFTFSFDFIHHCNKLNCYKKLIYRES